MKERRLPANDGKKKKEKILSKDYVLLMIASAGQSSMSYFYMSTMPLYVVKLGGSLTQAGLVSTSYALVALISRPVSGILTDKYGRVKLIVLGALLCTITSMSLGFAGIIPILMLIRSVNGFAFSMLSTCSGAAVADILPRSSMAEGIGIYGLFSTIAQAAAPGIALTIIAGDTIGDFRNLFFLTAGICFIAAAAGSGISYERKRKKQNAGDLAAVALNESSKSAKGPPEIADNEPMPKTFFGFEYAVLVPAAIMMVMYFGLASLMLYLTSFARWKGFGNPGLYYTICAAGVFVSRVVFGRVADKKGFDIIIVPGMIVLALCLALIPSITSLTALLALAIPIGLAQGAVIPSFNSLLFKRCSPKRRGTASGANFAAADCGFAIGAPLLGALADATDYSYIYMAAAVVVALSLVLYLLIASDRRYNKKMNRNTHQ